MLVVTTFIISIGTSPGGRGGGGGGGAGRQAPSQDERMDVHSKEYIRVYKSDKYNVKLAYAIAPVGA